MRRTSDVAFLPFFPLASGLLTGKYRKGQAAPENTRLSSPRFADRLTDDKLEIVESLIAFSRSARSHDSRTRLLVASAQADVSRR